MRQASPADAFDIARESARFDRGWQGSLSLASGHALAPAHRHGLPPRSKQPKLLTRDGRPRRGEEQPIFIAGVL
jgi:hypothetical protein